MITDVVNAAFIIATIFVMTPFVIWSLRNMRKYGKGVDTSSLTRLLKFSIHLFIPGFLLYFIGMLGIFNII